LIDPSLKKVALNIIGKVSSKKSEESNTRSIEIDRFVFVLGHLYTAKGEFRAKAALV
jgi:hypothetical protein